MSYDDNPSNKSNNRPFHDVLQTRISRREVIAGGLAAAASSFFDCTATALAHFRGDEECTHSHWDNKRKLMSFTPVSIAEGTGPRPSISSDYQFDVLIPWGEPIESGGSAYNWPPTAADQAEQIGIGHDAMHFFPMTHGKFGRGNGNEHGMLSIMSSVAIVMC